MTDNPHPQISGSTSSSGGYDPNGVGTAQKSPHDTDRDASPLTEQSRATSVTGRSDRVLPTRTEGTALPRAAAGELLDAITKARRALLDRLSRA
jgi:hypothetical protein